LHKDSITCREPLGLELGAERLGAERFGAERLGALSSGPKGLKVERIESLQDIKVERNILRGNIPPSPPLSKGGINGSVISVTYEKF
jgi:hypothetical protein